MRLALLDPATGLRVLLGEDDAATRSRNDEARRERLEARLWAALLAWKTQPSEAALSELHRWIRASGRTLDEIIANRPFLMTEETREALCRAWFARGLTAWRADGSHVSEMLEGVRCSEASLTEILEPTWPEAQHAERMPVAEALVLPALAAWREAGLKNGKDAFVGVLEALGMLMDDLVCGCLVHLHPDEREQVIREQLIGGLLLLKDEAERDEAARRLRAAENASGRTVEALIEEFGFSLREKTRAALREALGR